MNEQKPKQTRVTRNHKKHPFLKGFLGVVLVIVLGVAAYCGYLWFRTTTAADEVYDKQNKVTQGRFDGKKSFSSLLMGTDTGAFGRKEARGNSDTMIIATVNPKEKKFSLMSVPRDTMAQMIGVKTFSVHKINAAYNIGGAKMAMATTSALLDVPLKYYIVLNMGGLRKLVNGIGGVTVTPPLTFTYDGHHFTKGKKVHLDGDAALAYSRMRYDDPKGDYGRQLRQRQVIMNVIEQAASLKTLSNLESILDTLEKNVRTNLTFNSMLAIAQNYRGSLKNQDSDYLHGTGAMIGDASYQVMSDAELSRTSAIVRQQLGLDAVTLNNNETYQNSKNRQFNWKSQDPNQVYYVYDKKTGELWNGDHY